MKDFGKEQNPDLQEALARLRQTSAIAQKVQAHAESGQAIAGKASFGRIDPPKGDKNDPGTWAVGQIENPGQKDLKSESAANSALHATTMQTNPGKPGGYKP